jgi:2-polyprenyl-3-methyl-5-hydroxy-6-metoxy-1,4-benzoquinol methylase
MNRNGVSEPSAPVLSFREDYVEWKDWDPLEFGSYSKLDAQYYSAELGMTAGQALRALEIGFGNGSMLAWLKEIGADTYGIETNPILIERGKGLLGARRIFADLHDAAFSDLTGTFTHVIAMDVAEHLSLEQLGSMLARIRALLSPAGVCILRFPNGDSPFGRLYQHGDPTHVSTLGSGTITYLAEAAGLHVEALRAPALPLRGAGLVRGFRRVLVRAGRAVVERAVSALYFGGSRIPLDPNYVAVLRPQRPAHSQSSRADGAHTDVV